MILQACLGLQINGERGEIHIDRPSCRPGSTGWRFAG
jgi:hypothetical protein